MENRFFLDALGLSVEYPLSRFADQRGLCTKEGGKCPELYILGFDELGREVFLSLFRQGSFLDEGLMPVTLNASVYCAKRSFAEAFLDNTVGRIGAYRQEDEEYLPLPPQHFSVRLVEENNIDATFDRLLSDLRASTGGVKLVYLCCEDEELNLSLARRLAELVSGAVIFAFSRGACELQGVIPFGCGVREFSSCLLPLAKVRNLLYNRDLAGLSDTDALLLADELWQGLDSYGRLSSILAVASLPFKLSALGLHIAPMSSDTLTQKDYMSVYEPHRYRLTVLEHYRWCASLVSLGYAQPSIRRILSDKANDGKSIDERLHPHLTDIDGLSRFKSLVTERDGEYRGTDLLALDSHLCDNAVDMLRLVGLGVYTAKEK